MKNYFDLTEADLDLKRFGFKKIKTENGPFQAEYCLEFDDQRKYLIITNEYATAIDDFDTGIPDVTNKCPGYIHHDYMSAIIKKMEELDAAWREKYEK